MKRSTKTIAALGAALAVLATTAGSCDSSEERKQAQAISGNQQKKYEAAVPFPAGDLNNPLDRANLAEYLKRNNDKNRTSYVYLLSMDAKVIAYYAIKGKVTSVSSQLLPQDDIVDPCGSSYCPMSVDSAGDDGTYGGNEPGVFFFTTEGVLITWTGDYIQSDQPMDIKTPVSLVARVD
ncbi:hypothetical protein [Acrocarpospora sp. B8E8]|uniref:hypothetical protein n=1 Tax=Acrocarpospora sp. B8E8 TaxID=3153572 RepID=UPI00325EF21E